jgi:hypothetical protein
MDKIRHQSKVRYSIKASPGERFAMTVGCGESSKLSVSLLVMGAQVICEIPKGNWPELTIRGNAAVPGITAMLGTGRNNNHQAVSERDAQGWLTRHMSRSQQPLEGNMSSSGQDSPVCGARLLLWSNEDMPMPR